MAHYAIDCWDVEVQTDRFGWVEIIGIADRTDFDLKSHSKYSNEDMSVFIEYDEPKTIKKVVAKPDMKKFGPLFKGDSPKIKAVLDETDATIIKDAFEADGTFKVEVEGKEYELTEDLVSFHEKDETIRGEKIVPHVIEPSFGIDRILYSVLLHSFTEDQERAYLKFPEDIAPVSVSVFPLVNKDELVKTAYRISDDLRVKGIISEYDASGTIGRRYARSDEIGVPFAVTVDHETLEDRKVTIRNRDSLEQVRVPLEDIYNVLNDLLNKKINFKDLKSKG
jgi:glycyl-tRNA synthetase